MEDGEMTEEKALQVEDTEKREVAETGAERTRDRLAFVPRADIYETEEAITVVADMPGVDETSLDITLENNVLSIDGYVESFRPEGYSLTYAEYRVGDYQRAFTLSDQIDRDGIEAVVKDGVLRLHLPKITEARKRKIAISAG
jgi:HSP20 family molecular chaperone IbpA